MISCIWVILILLVFLLGQIDALVECLPLKFNVLILELELPFPIILVKGGSHLSSLGMVELLSRICLLQVVFVIDGRRSVRGVV